MTKKKRKVSFDKDGKGFDINKMKEGNVDIVFREGNKVVSHLSLNEGLFKAFQEKIASV